MIEFITIFMAFLAGIFAKSAAVDEKGRASGWIATAMFLAISIAVAVWGAYQ